MDLQVGDLVQGATFRVLREVVELDGDQVKVASLSRAGDGKERFTTWILRSQITARLPGSIPHDL